MCGKLIAIISTLQELSLIKIHGCKKKQFLYNFWAYFWSLFGLEFFFARLGAKFVDSVYRIESQSPLAGLPLAEKEQGKEIACPTNNRRVPHKTTN